MTARRPASWKAILAMFIGGGAVVWHIMACVESPMSFAPNGDLAFTVMEPFNPDKIGVQGKAAYRLMILGKDRKIKEMDSSQTHLLSGPGYSPDGKHIAYLRLPLLTKEDGKRIEEFISTRRNAIAELSKAPAEEKWIFAAPENSVPRQATADSKNQRDITLPPFEPFGRASVALRVGGAVVPAELVVRDAETGEQLHSVPIDVPIMGDESLANWDYLLAHPSYTPDGSRVFVWMRNYLFAINPQTGETELLAAAIYGGTLSPDGRMVAVLTMNGKSLGLLHSDGSRATYVRLRDEASLSGLAWIGNDSLAVIIPGKDSTDGEETSEIFIFDPGGNLLRILKIPFLKETDFGSGELAVSPDGKHMAVSASKRVDFFSADGDVLRSWESTEEDELLTQPTFTPDSRQIAFKLLSPADPDERGKPMTTQAIVFFTPEGRELFRVPVPQAAPPESPEAPQPQPTEQ